ncbi:MAG: 7TM domain-containing protein [Microgenomates group bacterium]
MKLKFLVALVTISITNSFLPPMANAQNSLETVDIFIDSTSSNQTATDESIATDSTRLASPSAEIEQRIQEKKDQDITESGNIKKSRLAAFLDENPPSELNWFNFVQHSIRYAVSEGVQPNIIVLVLLFPLVASLIAASRHVLGLRGFGLYIPAVLSVALVSTGVLEGIIIFLAIAATALLAKKVLKPTRLPYLPRTALLLWTVSIGIFGIILLAPVINLVTLMSVNIFPILILVLLAENFIDAQAKSKQSEALSLTIETIALAVVAGYILKWEALQQLALTEPELLIVSVCLLNVLIGKFVGLRVSERLRFKSLIEEE